MESLSFYGIHTIIEFFYIVSIYNKMDLYASGSIRTHYIDPVSFVPNQRCSFELDASKTAYLTNMRLLDLGVTTDTLIGYNQGLGCLALIRNIRLMDARTELSALRNPAQYLFWKNCNRTNSDNKSQDKYLKRNNLGETINSVNNKVVAVQGNGGNADTAPNTTSNAYIDLREIFPLLNQIQLLPTSVFRNLRIEIEFESRQERQVLSNTDRSISVNRPVLACDFTDNMELVNQGMQTLMERGAVWNEIENDNFTIAGGAQATDIEVRQEQAFQSLAYRGKYVERILLCKQLSTIGLEAPTAAVLGYGGVASSQAWLNQHTQMRLNGKNILPGFSGATGDMERLGMVADEWGVATMVPGSNYYDWANMGDVATDTGKNGQQSWDCLRIGARVRELQVQVSRLNNQDTTVAKNATNAACVINLYAEVRKVMTMNAAGYTVIYG
tara:strand:- start:1738 stop:3063 length:1326 start_codon:yes stop_codon:yes gene_type:complete